VVNREARRLLQREGQVEPAEPALREPLAPTRLHEPASERTSPAEFLRGVRSELAKVAWPNRSEVANYATVVFVTLVVMVSFIYALNYGFSKAVLKLFNI
jgi:preprotein translocase SecE subunit